MQPLKDNRQGLIGFMFTIILLFVQSIHNYNSAHTPLPDDPTQPWQVGMGRLLGLGRPRTQLITLLWPWLVGIVKAGAMWRIVWPLSSTCSLVYLYICVHFFLWPSKHAMNMGGTSMKLYLKVIISRQWLSQRAWFCSCYIIQGMLKLMQHSHRHNIY